MLLLSESSDVIILIALISSGVKCLDCGLYGEVLFEGVDGGDDGKAEWVFVW